MPWCITIWPSILTVFWSYQDREHMQHKIHDGKGELQTFVSFFCVVLFKGSVSNKEMPQHSWSVPARKKWATLPFINMHVVFGKNIYTCLLSANGNSSVDLLKMEWRIISEWPRFWDSVYSLYGALAKVSHRTERPNPWRFSIDLVSRISVIPRSPVTQSDQHKKFCLQRGDTSIKLVCKFYSVGLPVHDGNK